MLDARFYSTHLEKVSRSFAFCIEELNTDLRADVALAYLLFRVLDTLEDSTWSNPADQRQSFALFQHLIQNPNGSPSELIGLMKMAQMKAEEFELAQNMEILLKAYRELSPLRRMTLQRAFKTMSHGMEYFALERKHQVKNLPELNLYCYFVAGCIGELLSEWIFNTDDLSAELRDPSVHFGLFLQKINILKDAQIDRSEGRQFFVAWEEVAASLGAHASSAFEYSMKLPAERSDYKVFCLWSLFLGLFAYPSLMKSQKMQKQFRLSRLEVWKMLRDIKANISHTAWLNEKFAELACELPTSPPSELANDPVLFSKVSPEVALHRYKSFQFA